MLSIGYQIPQLGIHSSKTILLGGYNPPDYPVSQPVSFIYFCKQMYKTHKIQKNEFQKNSDTWADSSFCIDL